MGCGCNKGKQKEAITAAAAEADRVRSEFERRAAEETAKASGR